jgi:sec-independent protein translocase protein TatA
MGLDNPLHIAFLVVILLLVFGARRLPEIGRSLGSGMREFKDSISGETKPAQPALQAPPPQAAPRAAVAAPAAQGVPAEAPVQAQPEPAAPAQPPQQQA